MIALEKHLSDLATHFIVSRSDFSLYTQEDHMKALAYRLLASAAIEDYVEARCAEIAKIGCDRLSKGQPTSTGRSLLLWFMARKWRRPAPIHEPDALANLDLWKVALEAYTKSIRATHGMDGDDLRGLVFPLGLRESQVPEILVDSLDALASRRNPASHTYINRAKSLSEPVEEFNLVLQILSPLKQLDLDLLVVAEEYPVSQY